MSGLPEAPPGAPRPVRGSLACGDRGAPAELLVSRPLTGTPRMPSVSEERGSQTGGNRGFRASVLRSRAEACGLHGEGAGKRQDPDSAEGLLDGRGPPSLTPQF